MLWYLFIQLYWIYVVHSVCPPEKSITPCNCSSDLSDQVSVDCWFIEDQETLENAISGLKGHEVNFLAIKHATLNYLPYNLFEGTKVIEIDIEETSFFSLSDRDIAFVGLEETLEFLTIVNCTLMSSWNWGHLRNIKNLRRLDIMGGDMDSIGSDFSEISHLPIIDLAFSRNEIAYIEDGAFSKYENLNYLLLDDNRLTELKRSMLPTPADNLMILNFRGNRLRNLPSDFFTDMPILEVVDISYNKFLSLDKKIFSSIWAQLDIFGAQGNPITCDCRVLWMLDLGDSVNKRRRRVVCSEPKRLQGMSLLDLSRDDIWC